MKLVDQLTTDNDVEGGEFRLVEQSEPGMGASRRQAVTEAYKLKPNGIGVWVEPEKVDFAKHGLHGVVVPVAGGKADMVIPRRREFINYPQQQIQQETRANKTWNWLLEYHKWIEEGDRQDAWMGPRVMRLSEEMVGLFTQKYEFAGSGTDLNKLLASKVDSWASIFIPILAAYNEGMRVKNVEVDYRHPPEQKNIEDGDVGFEKKRQIQRRLILTAAIHWLRNLDEGKRHKSKLRLVG